MPSEAPLLLSQRPVQLHGSRLALACLKGAGWRVDFDGLPARQGVLAVYPHTSNWDFVLGIMAKWALGLPLTFWGKDTLFRIPLLGRWIRSLGGVPVDRHSPHGVVRDMVQRMQQARAEDRFLWLALAPEGTRAWSPGWRTGFYQVATGAGVPLGLVHLDYLHKRVGITAFLQLCGDRERDMPVIARHLADVRGRRHALASPVQLRDS